VRHLLDRQRASALTNLSDRRHGDDAKSLRLCR